MTNEQRLTEMMWDITGKQYRIEPLIHSHDKEGMDMLFLYLNAYNTWDNKVIREPRKGIDLATSIELMLVLPSKGDRWDNMLRDILRLILSDDAVNNYLRRLVVLSNEMWMDTKMKQIE